MSLLIMMLLADQQTGIHMPRSKAIPNLTPCSWEALVLMVGKLYKAAADTMYCHVSTN